MEVLKVELEGIVTSFRYPHFLVGRHPSYRMPPPATIYGHICSALGEWIDPKLVQFGYHFTHNGRGNDYEHIYKVIVGSGRIEKKWGHPRNIELELDPISREVLLFPELTLYIYAPKFLDVLYKGFQEPRYAVILGRSQDLAAYRKVKLVQIEKSGKGYFESTLLPWSFRARTVIGTTVLMPRFIKPEDRTQVDWERYVILEHRVFYGINEETGIRTMIKYETDEPIWIDPETQEIKGTKRGIAWHSFVGEKNRCIQFRNS